MRRVQLFATERPPMKLRDLMRTPVVTVEVSEGADHAFSRMQQERLPHLVVLNDGEVVGVLRDLGGERGRGMRLGQAVGELMGSDLIIGHPDLELHDAAALLSGCRIGCLPVVDHVELIGIVTRSDLLDHMGRAP